MPYDNDETTSATLEVIDRLQEPFDPSELKQREGSFGKMLDYIDWPMAVRRMDAAVGQNNWDFEITQTLVVGDCVVCVGKMTVRYPDGTSATKSGCGGNSFGRGMNPDDAAKGAGSDALRKCASLFGVALALAEKEGPSSNGGRGFTGGNNGGGYGSQPRQNGNGYANGQGNSGYGNQGGGQPSGGNDGPVDIDSLYCEECGEPLTETRFKDGQSWSPSQLAVFGRRKHGKILDMKCYRDANQAKRRAEEALQQIPF